MIVAKIQILIYFYFLTPTLNHILKYIEIHYFPYGKRLTRHRDTSAAVICWENLSLHLFLPPSPPSISVCRNWTPRMQQNGKWSGTMAIKALPLPHLSLFIFYPNKWWSRKQVAKLRNKSTRDHVGLSRHLSNLFFSFLHPT